LLGREHSHESDGRLSAKSAIIVIGGISLLLWVLILEMMFIWRPDWGNALISEGCDLAGAAHPRFSAAVLSAGFDT
jgi:hypothetical protein